MDHAQGMALLKRVQDRTLAAATATVDSLNPTLDRSLARLKQKATTKSPEEIAQWEADEKAKQAAGRVHAIANQIGPRYAADRVSLDTFEIYHPAQRPVLEQVRQCAQQMPIIISEGRGLLFYGTVGSGKDHLMIALLYEAARTGASCRWVNGQDVYGTFRDRMDTGQREEEFLSELAKPQVLAISDPIPPMRGPSAWNIEQLYRLIDRRYRYLKCTWVSLNAATPEDADEKLSAPVFDRLRESAETFRCFWPSHREQTKKRAG